MHVRIIKVESNEYEIVRYFMLQPNGVDWTPLILYYYHEKYPHRMNDAVKSLASGKYYIVLVQYDSYGYQNWINVQEISADRVPTAAAKLPDIAKVMKDGLPEEIRAIYKLKIAAWKTKNAVDRLRRAVEIIENGKDEELKRCSLTILNAVLRRQERKWNKAIGKVDNITVADDEDL